MNISKKITFYTFLATIVFSCSKPLVVTDINLNNSLTPVMVEHEDQSVNDMIKPYKNQLDQKMNEIVGIAPVELTEDDYQSPLGNFIIDLILLESEKKFSGKIDMAVVTNGGLRTPIPQGEVTLGNIYELMPFNNEIVVLELKGESVQKMMNYAAERGNAVFSGITYKVNNRLAEDILIGNEAFDINKIYTLAVSDYLAGGGDKMSFLTESIKTHQLGLLFREAIIQHIRGLTDKGEKIEGQIDERVKIVN